MNRTSPPVLITKLKAPPAPRELITRSRLFKILDRGSERKLTIVCAPAGYGKTTLVSDWVRQRRLQAAWLSLDRRDDDTARFLIHLGAALQTVDQGLGIDAIESLQSSTQVGVESVFSLLINELASVQSRLLLILDDYHLIGRRPLHEAISFFVEHMPDSVHMIIVTRADPPLRLARLRARGQLEEVRAADLRFSNEEAAGFLLRATGSRLSADAVKTLTARTEGWIAGLQLAAISVKRTPDQTAFLAAFSGTHEYIVDYLTDEVLEQQPGKIRKFLLETSILDRLCAGLCAAVTKQDDAQTTLDRLREDHLFLLPLDTERSWYRYHALFGDMLRKRLEQEQGDGVNTLHARAARWYEQSGEIDTAIEHALQAGAHDQAISLVERIAQETLIRTEFVTFLQWAEALPEELILVRPRLCVYYASALILSGRDVDLAQSLLSHAVKKQKSDRVVGEATFFQAVIAMLQGDVQRAVAQSKEALELLPDDQGFVRSLVIGHLGIGYLSAGDVDTARTLFAEAAEKGQRSGSYLSSIMARRRLAEIHILRGELHAAWSHCERGLRLAVGKQGRLLPVTGLIKAVQGDLLREWNNLERARLELESGLELILRWSELLAIDNYIALARVLQAQKKAEGASSAMQSAEHIAQKTDVSRVAPILVSLQRCRLWVAQGDLPAATRWMEEHVPIRELLAAQGYEAAFYHHIIELEGITLARMYLGLGDPQRALAILGPLYHAAERLGRCGASIEIRMLQALAYHGLGDKAAALSALTEALIRAAPEGYVRMFVDEGEAMYELLNWKSESAGSGHLIGETALSLRYMRKLISALQAERTEVSPVHPQDSDMLIDPLSRRELQVLRLLETHLTSKEIANELFISANTARFHIKNIYSKLAVHNRADAVQMAREAGLL